MAKGIESDQIANSGTANNMSSALNDNATNLYGSLAPTLQAEAAHPAGYTPTQLSAMNTAAMQSAGGSQAGTVGQGALLAARTRNAGAAQNAVGAGSRAAGANLSNAAVGTQVKDANLAQQHQQQGISGETGLYNTDLGASENALGISNSALSGASNTGGMNNPWDQFGMQYMKSAMAAAAAGGGS